MVVFGNLLLGTVEAEESLLDCLKRELKEEIGVDNILYISDVIYQFHWSNERKDCDEYVFSVKIDCSDSIVISHEHETYSWTNLESAFYPMPENDKALKILKSLLLNGK
jgi:8-oxo-dGTP pyrophosphatase MutT (NUDIX family)